MCDLIAPDESDATARLLHTLDRTGQTVGSYVFAGHEACIRVLNPAHTASRGAVRWDELAPAEVRFSSTTQWPQLGIADRADILTPDMGSPDPEMAAALLAGLDVSTLDTIHVAQWDGYAESNHPATAHHITFPPGRECFVWTTTAAGLLRQERIPMRWWHPHLNWTVGNDIYARTLFVSGTRQTLNNLLTSPTLETYEVDFTDPVQAEDR